MYWYKPNLLEEGQNHLPIMTKTQENDLPGKRTYFTNAIRGQL